MIGLNVKYKNKDDIRLSITNNTIILEGKSLILKKYKTIEKISINNKTEVISNKLDVSISSYNKIYRITCKNILDVSKLRNEIINIKTGTTTIERVSDKALKTADDIKKTVTILSSIVSIGVGLYSHFNNKK